MKAVDALVVLVELGVEHEGLVTSSLATQFGVSAVDLKRLADKGYVHRLRRSVYALPSATYGPIQELRAAWLEVSDAHPLASNPPGTVVSHASAAALHGMGELIPRHHEFTSPRRRQSVHADVRFHRREMTRDEITHVDGLPVTTVERTVVDLARTGTEFEHLAAAVTDGLALSSVTLSSMTAALDAMAHRYDYESGHELLEAMVEVKGLPWSACELAMRNGIGPHA